MDNGKAVGLVALDLSKAFDSIDHHILVTKLRNFGIGPRTLSFFINYLKDRTITVRTAEEYSKICSIQKGVPQGSILGPILFTLYINDLPAVVRNSNVMLYADDTTLFTSSNNPEIIQANLNGDLLNLENWFDGNRLKLNTDKSEYVLITNSHIRHKYNNVKISIGGKVIEEKEQAKILGVTISNDLSWDKHTTKVINSMKFCFRSFSRSCKMLNTDTRKLLYNAVIASRLNYCDAIWDSCTVGNKKKLQSIQNRCARRILNCIPGTSSAPLRKELGWLPLDKKRTLHKCVLLHRLMHNNGPKLLLEMLSQYKQDSGITTRRNSNGGLFIPRYNTNYMAKSFFVDTAKTWNSIPLSIKQTVNNTTFKEKLHIYFLNETLE